MSSPGVTNGFRPQEVSRARFQSVTTEILGSHKSQIDHVVSVVKAQGEFLADMSVRLDEQGKAISSHQGNFEAWGARTFMERLRWLFQGK